MKGSDSNKWRYVPALLALALGALPYLARPETTLFGAAAGVKDVGPTWLRHLPDAIRGSLPDAAWAFALAYTIGLLWAGGSPLARRAWVGAGLALAAGWEIGQACHLVPGTFDVVDLLASIAAYGAGLYAARRMAHEHEHRPVVGVVGKESIQ